MQVTTRIDAASAVADLRQAVTSLLDADLSSLDGMDVAGLLGVIETQRRRLDAVAVRVDVAADEQRLLGRFADCTLADLLISKLHIDPGEARRRAERAALLGPRRALTGEPLEPILPRTAAALAHGDVSAEHADVVLRYVEKVDDLDSNNRDAAPVVERLLLQTSCHEPPRSVARLGETLLVRLDPDGTEPRDALIERERDFSLMRHADGSASPRGRWTPELAEAWNTILDALAAPNTGEGGEADDRKPGQRRHDAMLDAANRLLRGGLPPAGGAPVTMLVRVTADQLAPGALDPAAYAWDGDVDAVGRAAAALAARPGDREPRTDDGLDAPHADGRAGVALSGHGELLSMRQMSFALCDAQSAVLVTDRYGGVLAYGRRERLATRAQRLALAARDGGCCFPGCSRPSAWTEVHHAVPWQLGGATDLANLCLVCSFHHRHFERLGWTVRMRAGVPEWIPPPWVDPEQRPQRNTGRHLADYDFPA